MAAGATKQIYGNTIITNERAWAAPLPGGCRLTSSSRRDRPDAMRDAEKLGHDGSCVVAEQDMRRVTRQCKHTFRAQLSLRNGQGGGGGWRTGGPATKSTLDEPDWLLNDPKRRGRCDPCARLG